MEKPDRVPGLDGLRASSIALVLGAHAAIAAGRSGALLRLDGIDEQGANGVAIFFSVSGFLITTLLLRERMERGTISLRAFYLRRAFRILPAFWVFLLATAVLSPRATFANLMTAFFFVSDIRFIGEDWWLSHTWSLSVEEQFYLLWPLALSALPRKRAIPVALGLFLAAPVVRVACYYFLPGYRGHSSFSPFSAYDTVLGGCVLALLLHENPADPLVRVLRRPATLLMLIGASLLLSPPLTRLFGGSYSLTIGFSLRAVTAAAIVAGAVALGNGAVRTALHARLMVHLGRISYSLYLWQQPFLDPILDGYSVLWRVTGAIVVAEVSFFGIERPFLRLRERLMARRASPLAQSAVPSIDAVPPQ